MSKMVNAIIEKVQLAHQLSSLVETSEKELAKIQEEQIKIVEALVAWVKPHLSYSGFRGWEEDFEELRDVAHIADDPDDGDYHLLLNSQGEFIHFFDDSGEPVRYGTMESIEVFGFKNVVRGLEIVMAESLCPNLVINFNVDEIHCGLDQNPCDTGECNHDYPYAKTSQ